MKQNESEILEVNSLNCNMRRKRKHRTICNSKFHNSRIKTEECTSYNLSEEDITNVSCMTVSNFPCTWVYNDIKDYIEKECGPAHKILMCRDNECKFNGSVEMIFEECVVAMKKLIGKEVSGKKLSVQMTVPDYASESDTDSEKWESHSKRLKSNKEQAPGSDTNIFETAPDETYGLKMSFLRSIGVKPPIHQWVYVSNFRCDKAELKEVLEMAGHVVICSQFHVPKKLAKVMYSHPLEAVQAISMLNGQIFYGHPLKVYMPEHPNNTVLLPKALADIGPGLGVDGVPLREVRRQFKRFVQGQESTVNRNIFIKPDEEPADLENEENNVTDVNVLRAMEAVKELNAKGVTSEHLMQALKELSRKSSRRFKVMNVEEVVDIEENNSKTDLSSSKSTETSNLSSENLGNKKLLSCTKEIVLNNTNGPKIEKSNRPIDPQLFAKNSGSSSSATKQIQDDSASSTLDVRRTPIWTTTSLDTPLSSSVQPSGVPTQTIPQQLVGIPVSNIPHQPVGMHPSNAPCQPMGIPHQNVSLQPMNAAKGSSFILPTYQYSGHIVQSGIFTSQAFGGNVSSTLQINNLPPSASYEIVRQKLELSGQILSLRMVTPGVAVVQYANSIQAQDCYQKIHNSHYDGNLVTVRYV